MQLSTRIATYALVLVLGIAAGVGAYHKYIMPQQVKARIEELEGRSITDAKYLLRMSKPDSIAVVDHDGDGKKDDIKVTSKGGQITYFVSDHDGTYSLVP